MTLLCWMMKEGVTWPRFLWIVGFPTVLAYRGYRRQKLSLDGAVAACCIGVGTAMAGDRFTALLLAFYVSGTFWTRYKQHQKCLLEGEQFKQGGQRNAVQVLANSLVATALALFASYYACVPGASDPRRAFVAYLCHYACCTGDTWASEIGSVHAQNPILVTTFRKVPAGTNGGLSIVGTLASLAGGAFIGATAALADMAFGPIAHDNMAFSPGLLYWTSLGAFWGFVGSMLDSILGATLQASYLRKEGKRWVVVSNPAQLDDGRVMKHISGFPCLTNEQVNFVSATLCLVFAFYVTAP